MVYVVQQKYDINEINEENVFYITPCFNVTKEIRKRIILPYEVLKVLGHWD